MSSIMIGSLPPPPSPQSASSMLNANDKRFLELIQQVTQANKRPRLVQQQAAASSPVVVSLLAPQPSPYSLQPVPLPNQLSQVHPDIVTSLLLERIRQQPQPQAVTRAPAYVPTTSPIVASPSPAVVLPGQGSTDKLMALEAALRLYGAPAPAPSHFLSQTASAPPQVPNGSGTVITYTPPPSHSANGDRLIPVATPAADESWVMSEYQSFLRQQICYVEWSGRDNSTSVTGKAQGRNKALVRGQVGITCRHCAAAAAVNTKAARGATYFPAKVDRIYQAAQNMSHNHFIASCPNIPAPIRNRLLGLKEIRAVATGSGKEYWRTSALQAGIREGEQGLFLCQPTDEKSSTTGTEQ